MNPAYRALVFVEPLLIFVLIVAWWRSSRPEHRQRWWCAYCGGLTEHPMTVEAYRQHIVMHLHLQTRVDRTRRIDWEGAHRAAPDPGGTDE